MSYKWVCRNKESHTRTLFKESLEAAGMPDCDNFNMVSEVSSPTSIVQTVFHSAKDTVPTTSIVSRYAIADFVKAGILFESRLPNVKIQRKLYIAYLKENPYQIDVIGFNGYNDPPEVMDFIEKYMDRDGIFESVMNNKLESVYSDLRWGAPVFNS